MDIKELEMILKEGEGYKIEFKEGFNNLDKEIVAFANSSGGRIFLGVTDECKIKGIGISNELKSRIQDIANNCRPKIKISIENYWQEPHNFVLGETVFRRNHIIADPFARIHFGEKMGSGLERIKEICKKENAPFLGIEFNQSYFYVTFRQSEEYLKLPAREEPKEKVEVVLNERQRQAIEYVESHKHITISEYISLNKVSDKTARRDLNDLVEKGLFVKEGSTTDLKFRSTPVNFGQLRSKSEGELNIYRCKMTDIGAMPEGLGIIRLGMVPDNNAKVVFQTGLTGSTGCVLSYNPVHTVVMEAKSK